MIVGIILLVIGNITLFSLGYMFYRHTYARFSVHDEYNDFELFVMITLGIIGGICIMVGGCIFFCSLI